MTGNITRVVVRPRLKNDLLIIKNHLTTTNIKTKGNFQRKFGILSQQINSEIQKLPGKSYEDAPSKSCNIKMKPLFK